MKQTLVLISLIMTVLVISGWLGYSAIESWPSIVHAEQATKDYTEYQKELSKLIKEYDSKVQAKITELQQKGEDAFAQKLAESQAAYEEAVLSYQEQLAQEAVVTEEKLTEWYVNPIINLELQLAMVSLSEEKRQEIIVKLDRLKNEFNELKSEYEQMLDEKLQVFMANEEEVQKAALSSWAEDYQAKLANELEIHVAKLEHQLNSEVLKLESALGRATTARE